MSAPAVEIQGLSRNFGSRVALDHLTFSVEKGESFGLLGPNGSGKSTLFRILSTLLAPGEGTASIFGHDIAKAQASVRALIGVVFQSPSLDKKLRVGENLSHHGRLYGLSGSKLAERRREVLLAYGLTERENDLVETLSGGLARRVEIAKALLPRPSLLLLDEPSTGLDPGARADLWGQLEKARREDGVTILLTTHLLDEAEGCSRLALLDQGRLVALGSPQALKSEISGSILVLETKNPSELEARLRKDLGLEPQRYKSGFRLEHKDPHALAKRISEELGGLVDSLTVGKPTLEDVFLRKTGHGLS